MSLSTRVLPLALVNEVAIQMMGVDPEESGTSVSALLDREIEIYPPIDCQKELGEWRRGQEPAEEWTFFTQSLASQVVHVDDIHEFTRKVSRLKGVAAVLAEEVEHQVRHVTTLVQEESEALVEQVIDAQADMIEDYPSHNYSFHIRVATMDENGQFRLPEGQYFLLPWTPE